MLHRRRFLQASGAFALAYATRGAFAADGAPSPIIFLHGDSDQASIWQTTIWRFESNGFPTNMLFPIDFANPQARDDDTKAQPNRSSTAEQLAQLTALIEDVKKSTGAPKVAVVALSRGGYAIRDYLSNPANIANISHAVTCGTPNHGVFSIPVPALLGSEYNGAGAYLKRLNGGPKEVPDGVSFLTIRSDVNDKYAQANGRFIGHPEMKTNILPTGPALTGATNVVLSGVDHRETAYNTRAFAEMYNFILGRAPAFIAITPQDKITLNGKVTGLVGTTPTNLPVEAAKVEVYRVSTLTGERVGDALLSKTTGADGVWGPLEVDSKSGLEFVVASPNMPITHIYRSPLPRSFDKLNLRPALPDDKADADAAAIVRLSRPRGYFGIGRDIILLDGVEPKDILPGVPASPTASLRLSDAAARPIVGEFNEERIVARPWPAKDNHRTIMELTS